MSGTPDIPAAGMQAAGMQAAGMQAALPRQGPGLMGSEVRALAKLTLSLRVTGRRPDGFHTLESEMVTVDLADSLYFFPGYGIEVVDAGAALGGHAEVPADGTNLAVRALDLLGIRAQVRLVKRVPAGGGLGGGSADAAAVLRWAGLAGERRGAELAAKLGSDVPFCLAGGRAMVTGTGEVLEPLDFMEVEGRAYTLLTPPFGVNTAAVYKAWDSMGGPQGANGNDLEPAALAVEPRLGEWRDRLGAATGQQPTLAGSGSTWYVTGAHPGEGRTVVRVARP
ncbi:MAG TPA: 4-(cytidine 5'-diphospho)-2-C-methyl-D-erythritol kinase [Acidimicrobiales bacterium]|nr:4-(cytidine 5'-diphospho)-2-C-methyl-D-erythritol kinase [Acidimicrobiales bacterium]